MQITYTLNDIDAVARRIIQQATSKIILFNAEMGMGKTTLIKSIVKILGSNDAVSSPTFSLVNEYITKTESIFHFDLYRIENEEELYDFGIEDYLYSKNNWILIEWPEIITPLLNDSYNTIKITEKDSNSRVLNIL